jgi:DNA-binding transcriptional LysR family regulator
MMLAAGPLTRPFRIAAMTAMLDTDQLRTFIAISETGSFTKAADVVNKTQSAVSMQMKRLEERLERPIFSRDGRASRLTEDGQRLLDYARRIVKLNVETLAAFSDAELSGRVRLGVPDDYADRYLPEIMARFSHSYPAVELSVICEPSVDLLERIDANELDLAIVTNCESKRASETFRRERLLWVTSNRHSTHLEERMPLALGRPSCTWRRIECRRSCCGCARGTCGVGIARVRPAPRHARARGLGWISGVALLPHRAGAQCARKYDAGRRTGRAHCFVAR